MPEAPRECRRLLAIVLVMVAALVPAAPALAHAVKLFAAVEGNSITGEVYFTGGGGAAGANVVALGPDGAVIGRAVADESGRFAMPVTRRVEHRLVADTAEGHAASFIIPADALPPAVAPTDRKEDAVGRQVTLLRRDLARMEDRLMWRDVIGALGYIVGLFGLAAFLLARRRG